MKKFLALAALVLRLASCQTEPEGLDVNVGGAVDTVVTVNIPEAETRANDSGIGVFENGVLDGDATMRYIFQVYYNGKTNEASRQVKYTDGTSVSFPVRLVPGRDYQFVVWADVVTAENAGDNHYNTADLENITLSNPSTWVAMDETRDAFTASHKAEKYNGSQSINIDLYRPFAKLRVVTTDYTALANLGAGIEAAKATVKYTTEHRSAFDAYSSEAKAADKADVEHTKYVIAEYTDEDDASRTIFSDYFFAENGDIVKFEMTVYDTNGQEIVTRVFNTDINVNRNYLTTIKGDILTDGNNVNVEVKPGFGDIEWPNTLTGELAKAAMLGGEVTLTEDVVLNEPLNVTANMVVNLGDYTISNANGYAFENSGDLTISANNQGGIAGLGGIRSNGGKVTINGGTYTGSSDWNNGTFQHLLKAVNTEVVINDGTFDATIGGITNALINVSEGSKVTINGGKFKNVNGAIPQFPPYLFTYEKNGKLIINDGEFYGGWRFNGESATTDIYGGDFTVGFDGQSFHASSTHVLTVYGGTFTPTPYANNSLTGKLDTVVADGYYVNVVDGKYEVNDFILTADTAGLQAALDAATDGTTIHLTAGVNYGVVYMGRPTRSNNTTMICDTHNFETTDEAAFAAHLNDGAYHTTPKYITTLKNLTIVGAQGATIAGLLATSGHAYGDNIHDYVLGVDKSGSVYYNTLHLENIKFSKVAFTGKIDINTSDAESTYNGITFDDCTFTTGGTASSNGPAIRYYNEANNGKVKNITVKNCKFNNCYQGVYVHHVNGITITDNEFDTTGHNAIAMQGHDGEVNLKGVVIKNNIFKNIGDRIIRFNNVGADSQITIQYNTATNSGDVAGEVIKATSIATGVTTDICFNNWDGGIVVNPELRDYKRMVTPSDLATIEIESNREYYLNGNFANSNVSLVMAVGVENVIFDGTDATNINELIITQNGSLINNANTHIGERSGMVTVQNFNVLSQINVFACKTTVVVEKNSAEALMIHAGNCDVKVLNNTIDANFESHPTYRNATSTWNTNNYGIALNIFDYNLWLDGNTVTDAVGHAIGINGWEGTFDTGDENKIESFKNNNITVNSTSNTKRAAFKVWDDETYASNDDDTNAVNPTAQAFIDAVLADGSNTFNIISGYDHTIFSFYNVNTNN